MTITVEIKPEVQAELAPPGRRQRPGGRSVCREFLKKRSICPQRQVGLPFDKQRAQAAGARIRELRNGVSLDGLTIRELIDEGRP